MDYARFVALRGALWDDLAARLEAARRDARTLGYDGLEGLALQYRQVLHDHARAASRFPGTGAAARLRRLALDATHWLQRDPADRAPSLRRFFRESFPRAFRRRLPDLGITAALFATAGLSGLGLALAQPGSALALLGPQAVDGLREGRLWTESLTTTVPPSLSSSAIATNNMSVALTAFAGGALGGLGALYVTLLNGFLLGATFGATARYSMEGALAQFVCAHGPLEITLILTSAAAGLGLGRALVAAADRPRRDLLRDAGRDGLLLLLGCLPWFALLGLVEALVSPSPGPSVGSKALLGAALEGLFLLVALRPVGASAASQGDEEVLR
jgi:uncharacterized membrane protein SpoIIM required for sporulation